jgi:hypothetical protein
MLPFTLNDTLPAYLTICLQLHIQNALKYTPSALPSTPPNAFSILLLGMLTRTLAMFNQLHTPSQLDFKFASQLSEHSQVHTVYTPEYTS